MGGGQMQLVAIGAQDIHLTGNPQITYFKTVYRQHTNFAIESIAQTFSNGTFDFGVTNLNCRIARNGDLIHRMYLELTLPALTGVSIGDSPSYADWTQSVGHALIENVSIYIGGQLIDKHYDTWLDIWTDISDVRRENGIWELVGKKDDYDTTEILNKKKKIYIPLQFWFNRHPGLALPLISLQYHDVEVRFNTRELKELIITNGNVSSVSGSISEPNLYVDYIYLDKNERRKFSKDSHEYLIEQLQVNTKTVSSGSDTMSLQFNHPVKELIWVGLNTNRITQDDTPTKPVADSDSGNDWFHYGSTDENTTSGIDSLYDSFWTAELLLNGQSRFSKRDATYFRDLQKYYHHSINSNEYIYVYSFALKPEEYQPSGTCNFSKIHTAEFKFTGIPTQSAGTLEFKVYAVNYNVLKITNGMGALVYSN